MMMNACVLMGMIVSIASPIATANANAKPGPCGKKAIEAVEKQYNDNTAYARYCLLEHHSSKASIGDTQNCKLSNSKSENYTVVLTADCSRVLSVNKLVQK